MFGFLPRPAACCAATASCYQAHFCGLACRLSKDYGPWARCLVNRDSTALALLGTSLQSAGLSPTSATCCNPFASPRPLFVDGPVTRFAAAVTVCALGAKLDDDEADERGLRRHVSGMAAGWVDEAVGKAMGILHALSFPVDRVRAALQPPTGASFEATGTAFGEIVAHFGTYADPEFEPETRRALRQLGESLGCLVHAKDAWDDWESDLRRGRPNPLHSLATPEERRHLLLPTTGAAVHRMEQAITALPLRRHQSLVGAVWIDSVRERVDGWLSTGPAATRRAKRKERRERKGEDRWCRCCDHCDCSPCCQCGRGSGRASPGCDLNPCDGDGCGCECGGCDCSC